MTATSMKRVSCSTIVLPVLAAMSAISTAAPAPKSIALPGGPPAGMDYLAYDAATGRVWVPAGNTGNVDVIDVATGKLTTLGGFATKLASRPGRPARTVGPSSVTVGDAAVWIGNRGDDSVCAFDRRSLAKGPCAMLASMPDGIAYVADTREVWVTSPRDGTIIIIGVAGKEPSAPVAIKLEGEPEGYAVEPGRGLFYTNLEDRDRTLAIDVKTRKVVASWPTGCGSDGPRGLALDAQRRLLFAACTDGAVSFDLGKSGKAVGRIQTGGGVDNLDYRAGKGLLYVASARDGKLTVARVADGGAITKIASPATASGARNPVVDAAGTAYVADSAGGRLIVIKPEPSW
jgi:DNA-binding beta-propeller fold protein YncE